jgi:GWxTD domain-containing protein
MANFIPGWQGSCSSAENYDISKKGGLEMSKIMGRRWARLFLVLVMGVASGCFEVRIKDSFYKSFFEKARLIMTDEEIKIYKSLPDRTAQEEFIEEFWRIRDPDPSTDENEAKREFEERVRYANLWFGSYNPHRGRDPGEDLEDRTGWNEDRGRIYIILGQPDVIWFWGGGDEQFSSDGSRSLVRAQQWTLEEWVYDRFYLYVIFTRTPGGSWVLQTADTRLFEVLDWAKLNWISTEFTEDVRRRFRFKAEYEDSAIQVTAPLSRVSFDENFKAEFAVRINVYHDNKKVDEINETKVLQESEEALLETKRKNISFEIPYRPSLKGKYLFDIVVQDMTAPLLSKYRTFVKHKF